MRHHTAPNLYLPVNTGAFQPEYYPPSPQTLPWETLFADGNPPAALDIGCGRGAFLIEFAGEHATTNIFGIEVRKHAVDWINTIIDGENVGNAAALWYSVVNGLPFIESGTITAVFYFFPDPWIKKKHFKRRAFTVQFLDELHRVLAEGGKLYLMTDVPEVEEYQREILVEHGGFSIEHSIDWNLPQTDQERFCLKKNIPYRRAICEKISK